MSVKAIMDGTYSTCGEPLPNEKTATIVSKTAAAVNARHGTDVKSNEAQEGRALSCELHQYAIVSSVLIPSWASRMEVLIEKAGEEIQLHQYSTAKATLSSIRMQLYVK